MTGGPGDGIHPGEMNARCTVTPAVAASGTCVMLDLRGSGSITPGDASIFSTAILPTTADLAGGIFGLTTKIEAGTSVKQSIIFHGIVERVDVEAGTAKGDLLVATNASGELSIANGVQHAKIIGRALTAISNGTATVWFSGIVGFGMYESDT